MKSKFVFFSITVPVDEPERFCVAWSRFRAGLSRLGVEVVGVRFSESVRSHIVWHVAMWHTEEEGEMEQRITRRFANWLDGFDVCIREDVSGASAWGYVAKYLAKESSDLREAFFLREGDKFGLNEADGRSVHVVNAVSGDQVNDKPGIAGRKIVFFGKVGDHFSDVNGAVFGEPAVAFLGDVHQVAPCGELASLGGA